MALKSYLVAPLIVAALVLPSAVLAGSPMAAGNKAAVVVALPGYQVSVWARGTSTYANPDSILSDGQHVYVGYQNVTAKDGSDHKSSTSWSTPGRDRSCAPFPPWVTWTACT